MNSRIIFTIITFFTISFYFAQDNHYLRDSIREAERKKYFIEKEGKFGLKDSLGNVLIPPLYDEMSFFSEEKRHFLIRKDSLLGLINNKGKIIIPVLYSSISGRIDSGDTSFGGEIPLKNKFVVKDFEGHFGIYSLSGEMLYPCIIGAAYQYKKFKDDLYLNVYEDPRDPEILKLYDKEVWGYYTVHHILKVEQNKVSPVILENFDEVVDHYELFPEEENNMIIAYKSNDQWGLYNPQTKRYSDRIYDGFIASDHLFYGKKGKFYTTVIDEDFNAKKVKDSLTGKSGKYWFEKKGDKIRLILNGKKSKKSFKELKEIYVTYPDQIKSFAKDYFIFSNTKRKYGITDFKGRIIIPADYQYVGIDYFSGGKINPEFYKKRDLGMVFKGSNSNNEFYYADKQGKKLFSSKDVKCFNQYNYGFSASGLFYTVCEGISVVYDINTQKTILETPGQIDERKDGQGFIISNYNKERKEYIYKYYTKKGMFLYEDFNPEFEEGMLYGDIIPFKENNKTGLKNFDGKVILKAKEYDKIKIIEEKDKKNNYIVYKDRKAGAMNSDFQVIVPLQYQDLEYHYPCRCFIAQLNGNFGVISSNHKILLPFRYTEKFKKMDWSNLGYEFNYPLFWRHYDRWWKNTEQSEFLLDDDGKLLETVLPKR